MRFDGPFPYHSVMKPGVFLSLDGVDGAGKSTQLDRLADWLGRQGRDVLRTREPGGTAIGEQIRGLLLDVRSTMNPTCEMLLYMASRAQLTQAVIAPALSAGKVVLSDRFLLSTVVYQGHAGGLEPSEIWRVGKLATGGILPDWTGVLDLEPTAAKRRRTGPADRIEMRDDAYHQRVRAGFLADADRDPDHVSVIDADADPETVHQRVVQEVARVLAAVDWA